MMAASMSKAAPPAPPQAPAAPPAQNAQRDKFKGNYNIIITFFFRPPVRRRRRPSVSRTSVVVRPSFLPARPSVRPSIHRQDAPREPPQDAQTVPEDSERLGREFKQFIEQSFEAAPKNAPIHEMSGCL